MQILLEIKILTLSRTQVTFLLPKYIQRVLRFQVLLNLYIMFLINALFYHKIQIMIKQDSYTKANKSGEKKGAYGHWAPSE